MTYQWAIFLCVNGRKLRLPHWNENSFMMYDGKKIIIFRDNQPTDCILSKIERASVEWKLLN